jgi:hypothetical protein
MAALVEAYHEHKERFTAAVVSREDMAGGLLRTITRPTLDPLLLLHLLFLLLLRTSVGAGGY